MSTISRELRRNLDGRQRYRPFAAQQLATARLARPRPRRVEQDLVLAAAVQVKLDVKWSPEQISNTLAEDFPRRSLAQAVNGDQLSGVVRQRCCPAARSSSVPAHAEAPEVTTPAARPAPTDHRRWSRCAAADQRPPAEADDRTVAGHWEGDLITGRSNKSAIATLVERASGALMLVHLPGAHTTDVTVTALTTAFTALPAGFCRSLTWDRGTEMADHALLTQATGMPVFFADAHSPWQRGRHDT